MIKQLIHFYGTNNLEQTESFYGGLLGLRLFKDQGKCRIYQFTDSALIGFCIHNPIYHTHKSPIITFVVDDVDSYHTKLKEANYFVSDIEVNEYFKIEHFFSKDPSGYTVEVQRFIDKEKELTNE